jgi:hypothetical protein
LVTIASGMSRHAGDTAIRIANRYAALHVEQPRGVCHDGRATNKVS